MSGCGGGGRNASRKIDCHFALRQEPGGLFRNGIVSSLERVLSSSDGAEDFSSEESDVESVSAVESTNSESRPGEAGGDSLSSEWRGGMENREGGENSMVMLGKDGGCIGERTVVFCDERDGVSERVGTVAAVILVGRAIQASGDPTRSQNWSFPDEVNVAGIS